MFKYGALYGEVVNLTKVLKLPYILHVIKDISTEENLSSPVKMDKYYAKSSEGKDTGL